MHRAIKRLKSPAMPRVTERQTDSNTLLDALVMHLVAKMAADTTSQASDSDSTTSDSSDSDSDSDSDSSGDPISEGILGALEELYGERYSVARQTIPKTQANLRILLDDYCYHFPEIFRSYICIDAECFNDLVASIQDHSVFQNNSNNPQMPVEEQVAITLYQFGHYGNAASTMKVALWAGVGYGTVKNVVLRVMTAICDAHFQMITMQWPTPQDVECAKAWVEEHSCPAWWNGWLMVDGTLVPLFQRPHHYGNTYFDRKSNYSMNVQVQLISQHSHIFCTDYCIVNFTSRPQNH